MAPTPNASPPRLPSARESRAASIVEVATVSIKRPVRTRFSVGLQLGRMFPSLLGLLRQQYAADPAASVTCRQIAQAVIDGALDRSRDRHLRPVLDLQRRTAPLTCVRKRRRKAQRIPRKPRRAPPPKVIYEKQRAPAKNLPSQMGPP